MTKREFYPGWVDDWARAQPPKPAASPGAPPNTGKRKAATRTGRGRIEQMLERMQSAAERRALALASQDEGIPILQ